MKKNDLKEIIDLIQIRQYLNHTMGNPIFEKSIISEMNNTLILIDKKIVKLLQDSSFKEYIGYADIKKVIADVSRVTNVNHHQHKAGGF